MRVDANAKDAGRFTVFLDDVDISASCFEADDGEGWARCYVTNEYGRIVANPDTLLPDEVLRHGKIRIVERESGN